MPRRDGNTRKPTRAQRRPLSPAGGPEGEEVVMSPHPSPLVGGVRGRAAADPTSAAAHIGAGYPLDDPREVARLLRFMAQRADARGGMIAPGLLRRAAALLDEYPLLAEGCRGCGSVLSGRRRDWCGESCRSRWRRATA